MKKSMRSSPLFSVLALAAALALAACDGATAPDERDVVSPEDAGAMAAFVFDLDAFAVSAASMASAAGTRSFNRTAPCPAGGSVSVNGSSESSTDAATKVVSTKWTHTQIHAACAFTYTRGDKSVTSVIDGKVTASGSSSFKPPETRGALPTLLTWASTKVGSTTTTVGDKKFTCEVNVTESYDPAKKTFTITGVMCGKQINVTRGLDGKSR
jgi:hypothetical protein